MTPCCLKQSPPNGDLLSLSDYVSLPPCPNEGVHPVDAVYARKGARVCEEHWRRMGGVVANEPKVETVSSCVTCPFETSDGSFMYCSVDEETRATDAFTHTVPDWCPLRQGPVLVQLGKEA